MPISYVDMDTNTRCISLSGRLDFQGVESVLDEFSTLLTAGNRVIVDLSSASLICSMGIRSLLQNAKTIKGRGGAMVLVVKESSLVSKTLVSVGIDALVPIYHNIQKARQYL